MATVSLGSELLGGIARLNRWATRNAELEVPPALGRLLALIEAMVESRIGDLAAADHCSQPTMTTQVRRLEDRGWVVRRQDPSDARATLVSLTTDGSAVLSSARAARSRAVEPLVDALSDEARDRLRAAVGVLDELLVAAAQLDP